MTFDEIRRDYNTALDETTHLLFYTRDTDLQRARVKVLEAMREQMRSFKVQAIAQTDEKMANLFFHFQCVLNCHISFLKIWINLKSGEYHKSWDSLIESQKYLEYAQKSADGHFGLEDMKKKLIEVENSIFPGFPRYNSPGLIIKGGNCSICGQAMEACEHLEELVYWGKVCKRVDPETVSVDHSALVENPKDRRCIVTEITTDDGYYQDYFTWKKTRKVEKGKEGERHLTVIYFNNNQFDIF